MRIHGLHWRLGLPLFLLVLAATTTLAFVLSAQLAAEQRVRLERLARANATFVGQSGLPLSERLAMDLRRVTELEVFFRLRQRIVPTPDDPAVAAALLALPTNGDARVTANREVAIAVIADRPSQHLLLAQPTNSTILEPRVLQILGAFAILTLVGGWFAARGLSRPLRTLAEKLPAIESTAPIAMPEAERNDEVGDVARAFLATREALQDERDLRIRMEKVAVLGKMTASLAHEVQNPIAAIKLHAQLLAERLARPGDQPIETGGDDESANAIFEEAERVESLVNQWLFLGRPEPPALAGHDLAQLARSVVAARARRHEHARVTVAVESAGDTTIACDAKRIHQVLENLLTNAMHAMPEGGRITVQVTGQPDRVALSVHDDGAGFSATALAHFGEFFHSEREGGMGIGLAVAREIARSHSGELTAENAATGGARVTLELPRLTGHDASPAT
ncbi:MAG: HAMP domain-containing histidine kinase [bacterium]|nr:HAMP domain-containing histidine kinase [bacterium]